MAVGFISGRRHNQRYCRLSPDSPVVPCNDVKMLSLLPLRNCVAFRETQSWHQEFRLHLAGQVGYQEHGVLHFGGAPSYVRSPARDMLYQADLAKRPLQDHAEFKRVRYERDAPGLGDQLLAAAGKPDVRQSLHTPIAGRVAIVRDDLHIRLTVEGLEIFRFSVDDGDLVEFVETSSEVSKGDVVAQLIGDHCDYLAACFTEDGRQLLDRIGGDVLSATNRRLYLTFGLQAWERLLDYADAKQANQPGHAVTDLSKCLPRHLVQVPFEAIATRRTSAYGWRPTPAFQEALLHAVSPDSVDTPQELAVRSPCDGVLRRISVEPTYIRLGFLDGDEAVHVTLPACAEVSDTIRRWKDAGESLPVAHGDVLGDYVPRAFYPDMGMLEEVAGGSLSKVEDVFFETLLIRSGELGWQGEGALVDRSMLTEAMLSAAIGHWADFSAMTKYYDEPSGSYVLPAIPYSPRLGGFSWSVNGIVYDFMPFGDRFAGIEDRLSSYVHVRQPRAAGNRRRVQYSGRRRRS